MKLTDYKVVVADIDGTLTMFGDPLSKRNHEAFDSLHAQGIQIGIASGRDINLQVGKQAVQWGFPYPFDFLIGMNGGQLWDEHTQKRYDTYLLSIETLKEIAEVMKPFDLNPFIYTSKGMMGLRMDEDIQESSLRNDTPIEIAGSYAKMFAHPTAKIMYRMKETLMPEVEAYLANHPSKNWKAFKTQVNLIEFCDPRISKAVALEKYCSMHQIPLSQVMAFGDMTNDDEMLQVAGLGVCLANGNSHTKKLSDVVTDYPCAEDGFARFIEEELPALPEKKKETK